MPATSIESMCPPHHWSISSAVIDGMPYDHHACLRCGAEKDVPVGDSPSMFWDRAAEPESVAWTRWRIRTGLPIPESASRATADLVDQPAPSAA
jgi:hypothetical protein